MQILCSVAEPETQRNVAPAPNLMLNTGELSKVSQTVTCTSFFPFSFTLIYIIKIQTKNCITHSVADPVHF
jgi:hypothetical protein